jgi:hypothetical protein
VETFGIPLLKTKHIPSSDMPNCEGSASEMLNRLFQPPDAENRTSGGVGGCRGAIPVTRPDRSRATPAFRSAEENWSVDDFVATGASKFNRAPKAATGLSHPLETEAVENGPLPRHAENCLGRRGSGVQIAPPRPLESVG